MKRYSIIAILVLAGIAIAYSIGFHRGRDRVWRNLAYPRYSADHPSNEDAVFADAYRRLLNQKVISGPAVGPRAVRGGFHRLFEDIYEHGDTDDFRVMASHENPVVRAMGILCLKYRSPFEAYMAVLRSSRDMEEVAWVSVGCVQSLIPFGFLATLYIYGSDDFINTRSLADAIDERRESANLADGD